MNILVIGASRGTGALAVKSALQRGHQVTAFARSPERLAIEDPKLRRLKGDFHDATSVAAAVPGHEAVIITASASNLKTFRENPHFFSQGTEHVISAMKSTRVRRLVVLSALGVGDSRALAGWLMRTLVIDGILKLPFADHDRQERLVRDSGLDWVIARPSRLTNGPARGRYLKKTEIARVPSAISRADVADFLVEACTSSELLRKTVQIGG